MMFRIAMIASIFAIACGGKDDSGDDEAAGGGACDAYLAALEACDSAALDATIDATRAGLDVEGADEACESALQIFEDAGGCDVYN